MQRWAAFERVLQMICACTRQACTSLRVGLLQPLGRQRAAVDVCIVGN